MCNLEQMIYTTAGDDNQYKHLSDEGEELREEMERELCVCQPDGFEREASTCTPYK